jgi:hypothetical protein
LNSSASWGWFSAVRQESAATSRDGRRSPVAAVFLAPDKSSFDAGEIIALNGGFIAGGVNRLERTLLYFQSHG